MERSCVEEGLKDANQGMNKCQRLLDFMKKRQDLEEEYCRSLKKLCKTINLRPVKHAGFMCFGGRTIIDDSEDEEPSLYLQQSTMWQAFDDIVEDTGQMAKAHGMLAETIKSQLCDPLEKSIRSMKVSQQTIKADADMLFEELKDAKMLWEKAQLQSEKAEREAETAKFKLESATASTHPLPPSALDSLKLKVQRASERADLARSSARQCEDRVRAIASRHSSTEYPRVMCMLRRQESQRAFDAFKTIHGLVEAEREAGDVANRALTEMNERVASVELSGDLSKYDDVYKCGAEVTLQKIDTADSQILK